MSMLPDNDTQAIHIKATANPLLTNVSTRLDNATIARIEALVPLIVVAPGIKSSRAIATRATILAGLNVLEALYGKAGEDSAQ